MASDGQRWREWGPKNLPWNLRIAPAVCGLDQEYPKDRVVPTLRVQGLLERSKFVPLTEVLHKRVPRSAGHTPRDLVAASRSASAGTNITGSSTADSITATSNQLSAKLRLRVYNSKPWQVRFHTFSSFPANDTFVHTILPFHSNKEGNPSESNSFIVKAFNQYCTLQWITD